MLAAAFDLRDVYKGFAPPEWHAPEDIEARIRGIPVDATAKGMFLQAVVDVAKAVGVIDLTRKDYTRFKDYSIREFVDLAVSVVPRAFPGVPFKEGLRRLGQRTFPMFANTLIGTAIFSIAARSYTQALHLVPRAYSVSMKPGSATIAYEEPGRAIIEIRNVWSFPDSYQIGVFEGAMDPLGATGEIKVRNVSACNADLLITWQ
jgi:uncharacterized protein (TIGR02265 family)